MTKFGIYQQLPPKRDDSGDTVANLVRCGTLYAMDGDEALQKAYNLEIFRRATGSGCYPVVEAI